MEDIYLGKNSTIFTILFISIIFTVIGIFFSKGKTSINSYIVADRSLGSKSLTASLVASCFGLWILIGPSEAATWGGLGAIIGYALGQATPFLAFIFIGKRMRQIMPNGNSLTQFVFVRFGNGLFKLVLFLSLFYLFVYLCAEVTAIAKIINLISNIPLWQTSMFIILSTLAYTLYGGLVASIFTDRLQFLIIIILLLVSINQIFISESSSFDINTIKDKAGFLISGKYFYGYTAGITFFIAVFATNLFDQGIWQRVYAARSDKDLIKGLISTFFVVVPFLLVLGFFGIVAVVTGNNEDTSTVFFSLLFNSFSEINIIILSSILVLILSLVISSIDTLINAISSLIIINGDKFFKLGPRALRQLSYILIFLMSCVVFLISSKGYSVLFMFLFADLLCCSASFTIFYGMFKGDLSKKLAFSSVIFGLLSGLLIFPNQTFEKSVLIGTLIPKSFFPDWITNALLFWSFILATFVPLLIILIFKRKHITFEFKNIKYMVDRII